MDELNRAAEYAKAHRDELESWVLKNRNYGGAGALNGPVYRNKESAMTKMILRRARDILRGHK